MLPILLFNNSLRNNLAHSITVSFILFLNFCLSMIVYIFTVSKTKIYIVLLRQKLWWPLNVLRRGRLECFNLKRVNLNRKTRRQTSDFMLKFSSHIFVQCPLLSDFFHPALNFMIRLVYANRVFKYPQGCTKSVQAKFHLQSCVKAVIQSFWLAEDKSPKSHLSWSRNVVANIMAGGPFKE